MKITQRWHAPCGCVTILEWDDAEPEDKRSHTVVEIERTCGRSEHALLNPGPGVFETIRDDNNRWAAEQSSQDAPQD